MLVGLGVVGQQGYQFIWPPLSLQTRGYEIYSATSPERTAELSRIVEELNVTYRSFMRNVPALRGARSKTNDKLIVKFYGSRGEFVFANWPTGFAEAIYRFPAVHVYDDKQPRWYLWLLHEATHQLNREVAHLSLPLWAEEGLASYFSTSRLDTLGRNVADATGQEGVGVTRSRLRLGVLDYETYPLWWLDRFFFSGDLDVDIKRGQVIPLKDVIMQSSTAAVNSKFNLYYLHWLSLTHFLLNYDHGRYRESYSCMLFGELPFSSFEQVIGPIFRVEKEWYLYLLKIAKRDTLFQKEIDTPLTCSLPKTALTRSLLDLPEFAVNQF